MSMTFISFFFPFNPAYLNAGAKSTTSVSGNSLTLLPSKEVGKQQSYYKCCQNKEAQCNVTDPLSVYRQFTKEIKKKNARLPAGL